MVASSSAAVSGGTFPELIKDAKDSISLEAGFGISVSK
jgi:hypothetical protein